MIDIQTEERRGEPPLVPAITHVVSEHEMTTWDGARLFYRRWMPAEPRHAVQRALVLFHRGHEHSGRYDELVRSLALPETAVFAWDARGHGRSPGERGYAPSFNALVRDADCFIRHISREHDLPLENMAVLGYSVAGVLVAAWVHDYAPPIRAMVLATPAFRVKLYVPLAIPALRLRMGMLKKSGKKAFVTSYVKPGMLTHDPEQAAAYQDDPLVSKQIAVNILLDLHDASTRLVADAAAVRVPTLLLTAGRDWVVKNEPQRRFFERLSSSVKEIEHYPDFRHAIFHEKDRHLPAERVRRFLLDAFRRPVDSPAWIDADQAGPSKTEHDRLAKPLPAWSPRRWNFAGQRLFLKTIGRLSHGVSLGWSSGFNSGASLDHVYRNRSRGITPLGRLVDRIYLSAPGWNGIRQRKVHLQELIGQAIDALRQAGREVRIVDVAAGPGRYLLEMLRDRKGQAIQAELRDQNPAALEAARRLAREMGAENVRINQGDAFNYHELSRLASTPTLAVVSGLFELFPDNAPVLSCLRGLSDAMGDGGYLVYTNQPWHPQLEMIARVLTHADGRPWVMRCRAQAEMDALVREAGFEKLQMRIDDAGIFSVSLARRVGA